MLRKELHEALWDRELDAPEHPLHEPDGGEWGFHWDLDFLLEFKGLWKASNYVLTLTGSYMQDHEDYPDFWADVHRLVQIEEVQHEKIKKALALVDHEEGK